MSANYKGHPIFYNPETGVGVTPIEDAGQISDGYHTFEELYEHRCLLFLSLVKLRDSWATIYEGQLGYDAEWDMAPWKSRLHSDGTSLDGWFIAGLILPGGPITYHLPDKFWDLCKAVEVERAPEWDGHTSADVLKRLEAWLK